MKREIILACLAASDLNVSPIWQLNLKHENLLKTSFTSFYD